MRGAVVKGIAVDLGLVACAILFFGIGAVRDFDGRCGKGIFFGGAGHPCSMVDHVRETLGYVFVVFLVYWWAILLVLFVPPLVIWYATARTTRKENASV